MKLLIDNFGVVLVKATIHEVVENGNKLDESIYPFDLGTVVDVDFEYEEVSVQYHMYKDGVLEINSDYQDKIRQAIDEYTLSLIELGVL